MGSGQAAGKTGIAGQTSPALTTQPSMDPRTRTMMEQMNQRVNQQPVFAQSAGMQGGPLRNVAAAQQGGGGTYGGSLQDYVGLAQAMQPPPGLPSLSASLAQAQGGGVPGGQAFNVGGHAGNTVITKDGVYRWEVDPLGINAPALVKDQKASKQLQAQTQAPSPAQMVQNTALPGGMMGPPAGASVPQGPNPQLLQMLGRPLGAGLPTLGEMLYGLSVPQNRFNPTRGQD